MWRAAGRRFSFASATLRGHQLAGEERFSVEWHKDDDSVWYAPASSAARTAQRSVNAVFMKRPESRRVRRYEIYTVSRPATPLAWLTYPIVRLHQQKFARCSMRAVRQALQPLHPRV